MKQPKSSDQIQLIHGDAREVISGYSDIAFCFLDAEKDIYMDVYEKVIPNLVPGGILAADNVINHADELADFLTMLKMIHAWMRWWCRSVRGFWFAGKCRGWPVAPT